MTDLLLDEENDLAIVANDVQLVSGVAEVPAGALAAQLGPLWPVCLPHLVTTTLFAPITSARASQFLELVED